MKAVTLHRQLVSYESLTSDPPEVGSGCQKYQASTVLVPLYRGLRLTTGGGVLSLRDQPPLGRPRRKCSVCVTLLLVQAASSGSGPPLSVKDPESSSHLQSPNLFPN
ncbi:hypothetical protein JOQ06_028870 [Pogonophryne albipinna]|uniref:Uncharacterized protein n=1 Tax=Pogonophryne albipinna TaxID=1090488 RepID=A0AAD6FM36_9TELE|nr:hypothetical protein JOQ06_028870 [Pogonophryne albipinna]